MARKCLEPETAKLQESWPLDRSGFPALPTRRLRAEFDGWLSYPVPMVVYVFKCWPGLRKPFGKDSEKLALDAICQRVKQDLAATFELDG